jgi:hypothetical protein
MYACLTTQEQKQCWIFFFFFALLIVQPVPSDSPGLIHACLLELSFPKCLSTAWGRQAMQTRHPWLRPGRQRQSASARHKNSSIGQYQTTAASHIHTCRCTINPLCYVLGQYGNEIWVHFFVLYTLLLVVTTKGSHLHYVNYWVGSDNKEVSLQYFHNNSSSKQDSIDSKTKTLTFSACSSLGLHCITLAIISFLNVLIIYMFYILKPNNGWLYVLAAVQ